MGQFRKACLVIGAVALGVLAVGLVMQQAPIWQPAAVAAALGAAIGIGAYPQLKTFQFTFWIIVAVTLGMLYPGPITAKHALPWGGEIHSRNPWLMLIVIQLVMFGMGTQMSVKDFTGVAKQPLGVVVGIVCHFSIMPTVGYLLTKIFAFPPEIAAGVILIGSCSSGLASNVMAYIARANIALSVTVTAITTMVAPLMTPALMKLFAGALIEVRYTDMMMEIIKFVLVPICAALLHDYLKHASRRGRMVTVALAVAGAGWLAFMAAGGWKLTVDAAAPGYLQAAATQGKKAEIPLAVRGIEMLGFLLAAPLFGVIYHGLTKVFTKLDAYTPVASMFGIVYFTTVTTAAGRDNLLKVGGALFLASILHNAAGYFFGYLLSRAARLDKNSARSVAFEVGLQNGGMATGLASEMGKLATVGLAPAIFSPWMNVSGSLLANYWRRKPVKEEAAAPEPAVMEAR